MGRGDNRRSPKMRRRKSQARHKARLLRKRLEGQAQSASSRSLRSTASVPPISTPIPPVSASSTRVTTPSVAEQRFVVAADLVAAITSREPDRAIVWSNEVRDYFTTNRLLTGERRED